MSTVIEKWDEILGIVKKEHDLSDVRFDTWLKPLKVYDVSGNVVTNMSTEQIQTLVKNQLSEGGAWNIKSMSAEGMGDTQECFSMVGTPLYVTQPDQNSVAAIQTAIAAVKAGETFSDSEIAQ